MLKLQGINYAKSNIVSNKWTSLSSEEDTEVNISILFMLKLKVSKFMCFKFRANSTAKYQNNFV